MTGPRAHLAAFMNALYGAEPRGGLIEVRYRLTTGRGMGQLWGPAEKPEILFDSILSLGEGTDVYVGVAPRRERRGGRDAIESVHVLWVDADSPESIAALRRFRPLPAIVVSSGHGLHAYWPLWPPIAPDEAERGNRRLVHALGADARATDAARILRPPGTFNHKDAEPLPVEVKRMQVETFTVGQVVAKLPDPPRAQRPGDPPRPGKPTAGDDIVHTIAPAVYVEALTGQQVGRDGKIACPFHEDRTPSLHAYDDPERGWYCYGCGRGGTAYDLAAALWSLELRGKGFRELRQRLAATLLGSEAAA